MNQISEIYDIKVNRADGKEESLSQFKGKVLLIVNVASRCGFTPQYEGLQYLYNRYKERGFEVLGFPCNQFGSQEPGSDEEIQKFCSLTYDVTFPVYSKIDVNGEAAHPLYKRLTQTKRGLLGTKAIKWNFTKFLVNREGQVVERYGSMVTPEKIAKDIERYLK